MKYLYFCIISTLYRKIDLTKMNKLYLFIYYSIVSHLPSRQTPIIGNLCNMLRVLCCKHIFAYTGQCINIEPNVYFGKGSTLKIGNFSGLGKNCRIQNFDISIGDYVMMAHDVQFIGGGHNYENTNLPMAKQATKGRSKLIIGDDVWIGARATILGNVQTIGRGAIIGAGSVVTKPIPDYAIVAGNPARIIKYRIIL